MILPEVLQVSLFCIRWKPVGQAHLWPWKWENKQRWLQYFLRHGLVAIIKKNKQIINSVGFEIAQSISEW